MIPSLKFFAIAITATLLVSIAFESPGQEPSSNKKVYVRTGQEATLSGTVRFTGEPPKALTIDMSADHSCYTRNPDPRTDWFVVSNERLANVLVYVMSNPILDNLWFEPPSAVVEIEHKACRFGPHVLGMQVQQALAILNNDPTHHNVHPTPKLNPEWNLSQAPGAEPVVKSFARGELFIPVKCNQHPWEKAYVSVFNHPFFAVSDAEGNFKIEGLPPGSYKIAAWHEKLGEKTLEVVVVPGESKDVGFTFATEDLQVSK